MLETDIEDDGGVVQFSPGIDRQTQHTVATLLSDMLGSDGLGKAAVSVLAGGAVNRSFLVTTPNGRYVLRVAPPPEHTDQIGVDMLNSVKVAQIAGAAGVGPAVLGVKEPEGHSLIEFLPGVLNVETLREPGRLHAVGLAVRKLHALPTEGVRAVSAFDEIDEWLAGAVAQGLSCPDDFDALRPQLEAARTVMERVDGACLSHRDLNPQNCMHTGGQAKLIDWDFSGVDTPYLDLAMLITYADLDEDEAREFVAAVIEDVHIEDDARVRVMRFAHALREWMWCLMARASLVGNTATDPSLLPKDAGAAEDFYLAYGDVNRRFAQRFAADPQWDTWLTIAASDLPAPGFR